MATPASFTEEECLSIYWKIKNFSFCCETIVSPEYNLFGNQYWISLYPGSVNIECKLNGILNNKEIVLIREISFQTCDGSQDESISGGKGVDLRIKKEVIFGKRRDAFLPEDTLTVRIRHLTENERGNVYIFSQIGVKRKFLLWTLENFSDCQLTPEKSVEKSERYGDIKLTFKSVDGVGADKKFYIEISRTGGERCYYILKVSILDVYGKIVKDVSDDFVFEKKEGMHTRMLPAFFNKSDFLECKNRLPPTYTLSLKCNFAISLGTFADQTDVISYYKDVTPFLKESEDLSILRAFIEKENSDPVTDLQMDLKSLLDDGTLHDVSLQIGSEIIPAHKTILSARSPVFKAMFTKDMKEATNSRIVIEDFDVETLRSLVLYMYTDSITDDQWGNVRKLYYAADKYEVLGLKEKCVSFLKAKLSISNVCDALVLADLHQDSNLKTTAIDLISEDDSQVFTSEAWKELENNNSPLAFQVLREICCRKRLR